MLSHQHGSLTCLSLNLIDPRPARAGWRCFQVVITSSLHSISKHEAGWDPISCCASHLSRTSSPSPHDGSAPNLVQQETSPGSDGRCQQCRVAKKVGAMAASYAVSDWSTPAIWNRSRPNSGMGFLSLRRTVPSWGEKIKPELRAECPRARYHRSIRCAKIPRSIIYS